jgi:hypothetical protein
MASKINGREKLLRRYQQERLSKLENSFGAKKTLPSHLIPDTNETPQAFLSRTLPGTLIPNGDRHKAVWNWGHSIEAGQPATPRIEIWGRGGAKSCIAEQLCAYFACSLKRRLALYVCGTQDQADLHVQAIAALLEQIGVPRALNKYSASLNWTAQRLQTVNGFGVIGVGLNSRIRGARIQDQRPDLIILDDVDGTHDTPEATAKKLRTISRDILAADATDATVLFVQNKIHKDSAIAQVADGRADILLGATVTQEPAVRDLEVERYYDEVSQCNKYRVLSGVPTWEEGQDLEVVERQINKWGYRTFLTESQHEDEPDGGLWDKERDIDPYRVTTYSSLVRLVIGVDPSGSTGTEAGLVAVGKAHDGHYYVLHDDSLRGTPNQWFQAAIARYRQTRADYLIVERNYGGDMVRAAIQNMDPSVAVKETVSSRGKLIRAEPVHQLYEEGRVHHVGTFLDLEKEQCTWQPGMDSPNRLDALVFAITELMQGQGRISEGESAMW